MTVDRGRAGILTERLRRPPAKLVVVSSPPHAIVKVNKQRFGVTPRKISTPRFEHVRVQVALAGYKPWKKTVYLKDAESKVDVALVRIPPPTARRAAPRSSSNL
jgi:hypothetical protein